MPEVADFADEMPAIVDGKLTLLFHSVAPGLEFNDQGVLLKLLIQARLEFVKDRHGCSNDLFSQLFVFHERKT